MFAFASMSLSKSNIASIETQTKTHRKGLNPFLTFYIDVMLNVDANTNINVKCEHILNDNAWVYSKEDTQVTYGPVVMLLGLV